MMPILYNEDMTNNNNNTNEGNEMNFQVRAAGRFEAVGYFETLEAALDYMRRWNPNQTHSWYIVDENTGRRLRLNEAGQMIVSCA